MYVGKTSMQLSARMSSHFRLASKGEGTRKYEWLRKNGGVRVTVLESVPVNQSSKAERRWVSRISRRFSLLNEATAGSGNPGVGRVKWTDDIIAMLGNVADSDIAKRVGCERKTVCYQRSIRGIPASMSRANNVRPPNMGGWNRKELSPEIIALLGSAPDYIIAEKCGVSKFKIARERSIRGIESYAYKTGNNGRIKLGDEHRRWKK